MKTSSKIWKRTKKLNIARLCSKASAVIISIELVIAILCTSNIPLKAQTNTAYGASALGSGSSTFYNSAFGCRALSNNGIGWYNTAIGYDALPSNNGGFYNTASGANALFRNTKGTNNTAIGYRSLYSNMDGNNNTANGRATLYNNTSGQSNTAGGESALYNTTTGSFNTASGVNALVTNTTGSNNSAIGFAADVSMGNLTNATAIGANAKATASNTVQLGDDGVTKVYAGTATTATLIAGTLQTTSGAINTASSPVLTIEINNQKAGRIDANNTFYGYQSGKNRTAGGFNTAMGFQSLNSLTTGDGNTAIGDRSLLANSSGRYNTAVGSITLNSSINGEYNTAIGYNADVSAPNLSNATAIGSAAIVDTSNKIRLGNTTVTEVETQFKYTTVSDGRFKNGVKEEDIKGLAFIKKLRPVAYHFDTRKFQEHITQNMPAELKQQYMNQDFNTSTAIRRSGFIAQEVEKAAEETGYNFDGVSKPKDAKGHYSLAYSQFVVPLVKAVQELDKKNEQLQKEKEQQKEKIDQLQQRIEALEKLMTGDSNFTKESINKTTASSEAESFKLFPNPTTGMFTIMANHITNATIEVYDMLGNSVKKEMFANIKSGYQLDLSGHAKGTYWVNVISGSKKYTKQIVVQ